MIQNIPQGYSHKIVILKCCIESYEESDKNSTKKIKLPSTSNWDENLKSVLARIPKKYNVIADMDPMDWMIQIKDTVIDKQSPQQFHTVLSKTSPPALLQIVENIRDYVLLIHFLEKKTHTCIRKWNEAVFNDLIDFIRHQFPIDIDDAFYVSSHDNEEIKNIEALRAAFGDEYELNVYITVRNQFRIEYGSKSFVWRPSADNEWDNEYDRLRKGISTEFTLNENEFEICDDLSCSIESGQHLMANYIALMNDKLSYIGVMKVVFKLNEKKDEKEQEEEEEDEKKEQLLLNTNQIKDIVSKHMKMKSAVDELQGRIPFITKRSCYSIIMDTMGTADADGDITHTSDVIPDMSDEGFTLHWQHIIRCVKHEMWDSLSSSIESIVDNDKNNISPKDLNQKTTDTVLRLLKMKNNALDKEEMEYLRKLIKRARTFVPIQSSALQCWDGMHIIKDANISILNDIFNVHRAFIFITYHFAEYDLNTFIFNIHNNQVKEMKEMNPIDSNAIKAQFDFYPSYLIQDDLFEMMHYVFAISHYVHDIECNGRIIETEDDAFTPFRLSCVIIPHSTSSVYDDNIRFIPSIGSIDEYLMNKNVHSFCRNIVRLKSKRSIKALLDSCYDMNDLKRDKITSLLVIIDRRRVQNELNDILYIFPCRNMNDFKELSANYFFGFDFHVLFGSAKGNTVNKAYLRYGIGDTLRFYPEFLTSIIPRLFVKPHVLQLYQDKYKHGWKLQLLDPVFNRYYHIITLCTFISVNHDRTIITEDYKEDQKETLFFSDILHFELNKKMKHQEAQVFNEYLMNNDYDSDAILFDLNQENQDMEGQTSCIEHYFSQKNERHNWCICRDWVARFNQKRTNANSEEKHDMCDHGECRHIKYIMESLNTFKTLHLCVEHEHLHRFDVSLLSESYDHIISVHDLNEMKKYFSNEIGQCSYKMKCKALAKHSNRKRERNTNKEKENGIMKSDRNAVEGNLSEITNATLNSIHCYVLHPEHHLFRLQSDSMNKSESRFTMPMAVAVSTNQSKFTTPLMNMKADESADGDDELADDSDDDPGDDNKKDAHSMYSINFGTSVIEWLKYGEKPKFVSFFEEIVHNKESTVDEKLLLAFKQECFIKSMSNKGECYTLIELLSLKLYTDTTSYQSALRKAFWTSTEKEIRKSFHFWATNLYKSMLYHAVPVPPRNKRATRCKPRVLYHGLNDVFIVDRSLPMYNGPISTTLDKSVALSFSDSKGLIWDIQGSYSNAWILICGINVNWISQFKHEAEFLLINSYLPIKKTKNFTNDDHNKVDHLLYTLKSVSNNITNAKTFYNQIGFVYNNAFTPIIKTHSALYKSTSIAPTVSVLHRLCEELKLAKEFEMEYKVMSSKFTVYDHRSLHSLFTLNINGLHDNDEHCFMQCKYKMMDIKSKYKTTFKYNDEIKIRDNISYKIYVKHKKLFCRNNYVLLQQIDAIQFDEKFSTSFYNNLSLTEHGVRLNPYKMMDEDEDGDEDDDEEEEYEEEEEAAYDVKCDLYDNIDNETKQQILNAKYILKLCVADSDVLESDVYECKHMEHFRVKLPCLDDMAHSMYCYKLYVELASNALHTFVLFKTFYLTEYIFTCTNDIVINRRINLNKVEDGGGSIQIFSKSSIVISNTGMLNATECGFNNLELKYEEEDDDMDAYEEDDDMVLKYGATVLSDEDYDSFILGGGIIELISEKNIVNNGRLISNCGSIKIFAKNDFINNGEIRSKGANNACGDIWIQCRAQNRDAKSSIEPPPKIQNIKLQIAGFSDLERVISKNEHKINMRICAKNGAKRENTDPSNLLSSSPDSYYLSKDLHSLNGSDWVTFKYDDAHLINKVLIQNHAQKNGIKKVSLHLGKRHSINNNAWLQIAVIDNIEMNKSEQIFTIQCPLDVNQIADDKLCVLQLRILQNHGHGKSWTNRFYQFQVYGKYIYDVIPNAEGDY